MRSDNVIIWKILTAEDLQGHFLHVSTGKSSPHCDNHQSKTRSRLETTHYLYHEEVSQNNRMQQTMYYQYSQSPEYKTRLIRESCHMWYICIWPWFNCLRPLFCVIAVADTTLRCRVGWVLRWVWSGGLDWWGTTVAVTSLTRWWRHWRTPSNTALVPNYRV